MIESVIPFVEAGFAVHLLHSRTKRPIGKEWSEAPVATVDQLRAAYLPGNNVGVRLGEPSALTSGGYLHVFDLDIRVPELADEAWAAFARMFPGIPVTSLPCVASGSGGESRHLYFIADRPFSSKMLAVSDGKHRKFVKSENKEVWSYDWEIELFGTGKQVVLPPSIHPDTGKPYTWLREFDFDEMDMGMGPYIPSSVIESLGVAETATYAFETRPPLDFKPGQMEAELDIVPVSDLHYDDWIRLGQAIHHQTGGSAEGLDLWITLTRKSSKFTGDGQVREMRRSKWKSFGKYRGQPVTMASIRQWVQDARAASFADAFDDLDEAEPAALPAPDAFDDLLGDAVTSDADDFDSIFADDNDDGDTDEEMTPEQAQEALLKSIGKSSTTLEWVSLMDFTDKGAVKPTLHNLRLIVENDKRISGVTAYNEFTQEVVQRGKPGRMPTREKAAKPALQLEGPSWAMHDPVNGDFWTEDRDNSIRALIEAPRTQAGYGFKVPDRDLRAAVDIAGRRNTFHPVREYLGGQKWDGVSRVERLFVDYLGAPDDAYTRSVARLMMIAGVARVFEPGIKFDFAVILRGLQGARKSTFIQVLAKDWFAELEGDFEDARAMVEAMQGAWILEMPELGGFVRGDVRHIKAFVSRRSDKVRLAYAKRAQQYHRQCIFIGSTNDDKFLKDDTGNRRFWLIHCSVDSIDTARLEADVDQLWAEALVLYREMRSRKPAGGLPLYLTDPSAQAIAAQLQESARVETADDATAGQIAAWLDKPIISGDINDPSEGRLRNETCLIELWVDCMGRDRGLYDGTKAQMLGRAMTKVPEWQAEGRFVTFQKWGRQRVYDRGGYAGRIARGG